ncbi:hypothetical protein WA1_16595 [Scytonema hofmannii PCC 7110]|uniref:Uncharacterized protein n=1 Tax=Scytonema hofmannii PCC 7110 TaxID=128403 RepID=A0A139XCX5_9CYAN|nr:hypothetical protein WA1_16595 [Scytonema hofmannii PCC 7110]
MQNAAAVYTVATVAVNQLLQQESQVTESAVAALPGGLQKIDKAQLLEEYGSYNACRKAAKKQGIKFSRTPNWKQLTAAFNYAQAFQQIIIAYVEAHPEPGLKGTTFELSIK